ncbi:MAG: GNAT family N-acetyltransferase [Alphaproteobacteria bacterium]
MLQKPWFLRQSDMILKQHYYQFEPLGEQHFDILRDWFRTPEVQKWYGGESNLKTIETHLSDDRISMMLIRLDGSPLAYLQDYEVSGWKDHHLDFLPHGSRGMDTFIGRQDMLSKGHGENYLRCQISRLFKAGIPAIGIDPHPDNRRAVRAYEKLGFKGDQERETEWGRVLLMSLYREDWCPLVSQN